MGTALQEALSTYRSLFGSVPQQGLLGVCDICLGPVNLGFSRCNSCEQLEEQGAPGEVLRHVVPMTTARNPSPWYSILWRYKSGSFEEGWALAALVHFYLEAHAKKIQSRIRGAPSVWTLVPSKRRRGFERQPLRRVLFQIPRLKGSLRQTLRFIPEQPLARSQYNPGAFETTGVSLAGERVVLLEDTWVTGATAVSAAGALHAAGAAAVVVLPVARVFNAHYWAEAHPYLEAHRAPYDVSFWPRRS